jgi:hypothetical protein
LNYTVDHIRQSFQKLLHYCEKKEFKGYDPYDGLNSKLFQSLPLIPKIRFCRLAWIQFFKRSPINFRKLVGIKPAYNPKAIGLFLSAYVIMYKRERKPSQLKQINHFIKQLEELESKGYSGSCWGYHFDWESRAFFQPKFTPTIVASSFIANALLDAYEITGDQTLLTKARSTCDFILKDLNRTVFNENEFAFSHSPLDHSVVYNASLLGAKLLARVYYFTKEIALVNVAKSVVTYCCNQQKTDGSWSYGTLPFHQWVDNFHTGYNLECLADYTKFSGDKTYEPFIEKGFQYYINTFFTNEGVPKYYNNKTYPIDIHAPAQLMITLEKLDRFTTHKEKLDQVLSWTIANMQDKKGYFYYQIGKRYLSKIPYMRWSQAWMLLTFAKYLDHAIPDGHCFTETPEQL